MKNLTIIVITLVALLFSHISCSDNDEDNSLKDNIASSINPVEELSVVPTEEELELEVSWINPSDEDLMKVEVTYVAKTATRAIASPKPILVDAVRGESQTIKLLTPTYAAYTVTVVVINKAGKQSGPRRATAWPLEIEKEKVETPVFLERADVFMESLVSLYLDGKSRDIWTSRYPFSDGYWDGAALLWGHSGAFSGYVALKEAFEKYPKYKEKCEIIYDERLYTGVNKFITNQNGVNGYAVYPASGNDRYFDDNVWVGLDMVDLYAMTNDQKYLEKAKMVWDYLLTGTDDIMGGGVYWKEYPDKSKSKHTCSTAPTAVMAAKLYQVTKDETYLKSAKDLYTWCKKLLQDPDDYLYWDLVRLQDDNDPTSEIIPAKVKYSYNSGQPMQAAVLLYNITGEQQYLTDAQNIAKSAYKKWFIPFYSAQLNESFRILEPGHVWFQAIMFRGFVELYKVDGDRTYVTAYEKTMSHAWQSSCRNSTNLLNEDFRGGTTQDSWEVLHEGACLEILARLASLEAEGL